MLEGGGRLCPVLPVNTYNEPLDRQLMERVKISNFKGEVLMNRRTEWVEWGWKERSTGGGVVATKTKQKKRGGYLITSWVRYVEETVSRLQRPEPGWSPSRVQCLTTTPSSRGGGGVHHLILPPQLQVWRCPHSSRGSVKMQQGGAWGRRRRRGGTILIFGAKVLKVKVIPIHLHLYILWYLWSSSVLEGRGRLTRKYSQC